MYELILAHIARHVTLAPAEREKFCAALQHKKLRRRQYLLQEGDICRYDHFVIKGGLRQYEVDDEGRENVMQFGFEDWWISDWYSMLTNTPTAYNIEALEDTEVLQIERVKLEQLFLEIPALERYFRIIILHAFVALQRRVLFMQKSSAERYAEFLTRYAHVEQRVSQQHVASYLGITRETLSRLKSRKL
ncbi:Crp/Fnr family transcriptional regulator [uncultured Chitinophaga sp.]|jgi:cAMP-binding proteins - catabolite gene activator and regulatory subunit of cAMP-dependent protein kinases|uniref:Crp/Fnr family transcriptional regulator n=1 Tax=uncultured Chitinophaga sp. TaxID=339340 RepID=UPI0026292AD5|nr:Crp/Fnr family transcriptional regulator [uncultured Chitinophaga sp.]